MLKHFIITSFLDDLVHEIVSRILVIPFFLSLDKTSASCLIKSTAITCQEDDAEITDDEETDLLLILHDDDDVFLLHPTQNFK